ncbi:DUF1573 domain-containing protein [Brumimicrobium aurantiacum]|uniref:DUF1573 domain-containing protein n=1 Tax=Brumimicrobium aurantiacum TaxID=1737063 RepID=A0A3E1F105_9FLAO|nr:DUF1573 domain-containing protein [Brumimicrobium aurantiacum]RFC55490.1 DUF1573 domain-containing protein [Brumimicrobium aurantiacum]
MKKVLFTLSLLFTALFGMNTVMAQAAVESGAKIEFEKETHDYGTISQYADGTCEFKFTNTGNEPLVISNAKGSCGCTVPQWPREPIAPGESGVIKVKYDTKRVGVIGKSVTLQSNAINTPTKTIRIKGNVKAAPKGGAPVNKSGAPTQS